MRFKLLTAALLLGVAGVASADTSNGTMSVAAATTSACYINGGTLDFGNFPAFAHTNIDVAGNIVLECSANTPYTIYRTTSGAPVMNSGSYSAYYQVYADAARTTAIPTAASAGAISGDSGVGGIVNVPLYARIAQGSSNNTGVYSGVLGFTVAF